jgi:hypothetical protein
MNKLAIALAVVTMMAAPAAANAAACRNAQGHFIKCPPPAATATHPAVAARPATVRPVATHAAATPARRAPCRDAKGRFKKC